jgi:hypothetical protein
VEAPPAPDSHILPTPGQTPLVLDDDVVAAAVVDAAPTHIPAIIMVASASGSMHFRRSIGVLQNILIDLARVLYIVA